MKVFGHRGAMGYAPENTLRSFQKAIEQKVDMIEVDVQVLQDGSVIVMHDDTVDRTTNGRGFVAEKTLSEIKLLDAGKGEKVPTLQDALDFINKRVPVIIEMTGFLSCATNVAEIITHYVEEKNWRYEDFMVSSFIHQELTRFREILPQVKTGANMSVIPVSYAKIAEEAGADFVATENLYLRDAAFVGDAHERGLQFFVYSINHPDYLKRYEEMGIDGVFSNFPDLLIAQRGKNI